MGELQKIINSLNKKIPGSVMKLGEKAYQQVPRVSTGSFALDVEIGGGIPENSIIEVFGELSTGKSLLALKTIAEVQKLGRTAAYVDLENALDIQWAKKLGVNVKELLISQPSSAEQTVDIVSSLLSSRELGILVLDSIASMVPLVEIEKSAEEQQMGVAAKLVNKMVRRMQSTLQPINLGDEQTYNPCIVFLINQIRMNPGVRYGSPEVTPHGKGVPFAASIRVKLRRGEVIKEKDNAIGQEIKFQVKKNKTYMPFRVGQFDFSYLSGEFDNIKSIIQYAMAYKLISRAGAFYTFGEERFQGQQKLIDFLREKPKEVEKLKKLILDMLLK
jgi:recombination protein RecA